MCKASFYTKAVIYFKEKVGFLKVGASDGLYFLNEPVISVAPAVLLVRDNLEAAFHF